MPCWAYSRIGTHPIGEVIIRKARRWVPRSVKETPLPERMNRRVGLGLVEGHERSPGVRLEQFMPDEIVPVCAPRIPDPMLRRAIEGLKSVRDLEASKGQGDALAEHPAVCHPAPNWMALVHDQGAFAAAALRL
jgi:hypothetical protein